MGEFVDIGRVATPDAPLRCAQLISGTGSGMEAMLRAQSLPTASHTTVVVISNQPDATGIQRAQQYNVPTHVIDHTNVSREEHELQIIELLSSYHVELVILSGYMRLLSLTFIRAFEGRIINIHPSLLPQFPGAHAHRDVIQSDVKFSGCTVHLVDEGMDTGPILAQCPVPRLEDDDESRLARRVRVEEHRVYPQVVEAIAKGQRFHEVV